MDVGFQLFQETLHVVGGLCVAFALPLVGVVCLIHVLIKQIRRKGERVRDGVVGEGSNILL